MTNPTDDRALREQAEAALNSEGMPYAHGRDAWTRQASGASMVVGHLTRLGEAPADDRTLVDATKSPYDFSDAIRQADTDLKQQAVLTLGDLPTLKLRLAHQLEYAEGMAKGGDPTAVIAVAARNHVQQIKSAQVMVDELIADSTPKGTLSTADRLEVVRLVVSALDAKPA